MGPVRVSFVADIHGNIDGLARVAATAERLVVLGDLLDYVDYHDPARGILGGIFGADRVCHFAALRLAGRFAELHAYNLALWAELADPQGTLAEIVATRYAEVVAAVPADTLLTLGNVDVADAWNEVAGNTLPYLDGQVVELAGRQFGFIAGGSARPGRPVLPSPDAVWQPLIRSASDYRAAVTAVGAVDVLCSHIPPRLASLRYDLAPGRMEMYGPGLLEAIDTHRPEYALFGHVHQPLARRLRRGRTECVNVGHFQRFPQPFVLDLD